MGLGKKQGLRVPRRRERLGHLTPIPNGIVACSPGLPYSATLGRRIAWGPNPEGVAPLVVRMMNNEMRRRCVTATLRRNPFRVGANERLVLGAPPSPRVAEYGNPGL
jgi:hypothetical protein